MPDAAAASDSGSPVDASASPDAALVPDAGVASHCLEVVPGHNADDPNRINLVLFFGGFDSATGSLGMPRMFSGLVAGTEDNAYSFDPELAKLYAVEGLVAIEPFKSNFDRFNFWYVDLPLYGSGEVCPFIDVPEGATCSGNLLTTYDKGGNPTTRALAPEDLVAMGPAGRACDVPHRFNAVLWSETAVMSEATFARPGHYANFGSYAQANLLFGATTAIDKVFEFFVHEFVHAIGEVWDEKGSNASPADYPAPMPGPNCWSLGPENQRTAAQCAADETRPWHDLVGNGCGEDGVVDCPKTTGRFDPNVNQWQVTRFDEWLYEVRDDVDGCGQGCAYFQGNIFRPFQGCDVMSSCDLTTAPRTGLITRLGPVNAREVCRRIRAITGSAGGACDLLCLDGCAAGQRCIKGTCSL
ncbi:MAG TPA: hypothetical protein VGK67_22720 [Myxococcales bacterium]